MHSMLYMRYEHMDDVSLHTKKMANGNVGTPPSTQDYDPLGATQRLYQPVLLALFLELGWELVGIH